MNISKREFLKGIIGVAVASQVPLIKALDTPLDENWLSAVQAINAQLDTDLIVYGRCMHRLIEAFPYVERIAPEDWYQYTLERKLS